MADRKPPELQALFDVLAQHQVQYVVVGSTAAMLHGVEVHPRDLDIAPALNESNLLRLAAALANIDARPDPDGPFGDWHVETDGEQRWVEREPLPGEREKRVNWHPDATDPSSFDHLLVSRHGSIDVVPVVTGTYDDLIMRADSVHAFGHALRVAAVGDLLATLTVPRRGKDLARVRALRRIQRAAMSGGAS